ncbi:MAG: hypothetical protein M3P91_09635 [Actinomycetota bacterium]|nr:hypothetical protein [Actinomycetota bacterium]
MVVASAVAVVAALVLLVVGVTDAGLPAVYASIALSCLAGALLVRAVYVRRGSHVAPAVASRATAPPHGGNSGVAAADDRTHVAPQAPDTRSEPADQADQADLRYAGSSADPADADGLVWITDVDRTLFHTADCPRLSDGAPAADEPGAGAVPGLAPVDVVDAIDEGYRPCPQCAPGGDLVGGADS